MALLDLPASGDHVWNTKRGELRAWSPAPGLVVLKLTGHLQKEIATRFIPEYGKLWPKGVRGIFADLDDMVGYESAFRVAMTEWARDVLDGSRVLQVSVRSKIVQMGVAVANLALGGVLKVHPNRAALENAAQRLLKGH